MKALIELLFIKHLLWVFVDIFLSHGLYISNKWCYGVIEKFSQHSRPFQYHIFYSPFFFLLLLLSNILYDILGYIFSLI